MLLKNGPFTASFSLFPSFQYSLQWIFNINFCRWLDSSHGPLESEATALPTEPPPLSQKRFLSLPVLFASSQFRAVLEAVAGPSSPSWTSWSRDPCSSSIPPSPSAAHFETSCSRDRPTQASNHLWKATEKVLLNVWCHFCSRYRVSFSRSLPTVIQHKTCGQSYKHFTLVNYDSRVVPDWKIPHITTLEFIKLATGPGQM